MEIIKKNLILFTTIGYALGFLLHNIYLSKYGIYEFEAIQVRYIYSLITMLIFMGIIFFIMTTGLNLTEYRKNLSLKNTYLWFLRVFLFSTLIFAFVDLESYKEIKEMGLYGEALPLSLIIISFYYLGESTNPDIFTILLKYLYIGVSPFYVAYLCFIAIHFEPYLEAMIFFMMIWLIVYITSIIFVEKRDTNTEYSVISEETNNEVKNLYYEYMVYSCIGFFIFMIINLYSNFFYDKVPISIGGAKPEVMKIILNDNSSLEGKVIDKTDKWIYILLNEGIVRQIKIEKVNYIEIKY